MYYRQVDLVEHERLVGETMMILSMQAISEGRGSLAVDRRGRIDSGAMADDVSPQRDIRAGDISPQNVQAFVPIVELIVIAAFEAGAAEAKRLDVVAERCPDYRWRDVCKIGNPIRGDDFAMQDRRAAQ
jgi:hypothetical protein